MSALEEMLLTPRWSAQALHAAVSKMQRDDLSGIGRRLFGNCLVEALLVGNLTETEARALLRSVLDPLDINNGDSGMTSVPARAEALMPTNQASTILALDGTNPDDTNSCAVLSLCGVAETTPENE